VKNKLKFSFKEKKLKHSPFTYAGYQPLRIVKEKVQQVAKKTFWQKLLPWTAPKSPIQRKSFKIYAGALKGTDENILELLPSMDPGAMLQEHRQLIEDKYMPNPQLTVYDHQEKVALTCNLTADVSNVALVNSFLAVIPAANAASASISTHVAPVISPF